MGKKEMGVMRSSELSEWPHHPQRLKKCGVNRNLEINVNACSEHFVGA